MSFPLPLHSQFPRPGVVQHENDTVLAFVMILHLYSVVTSSHETC
jgi:hypothetical protein